MIDKKDLQKSVYVFSAILCMSLLPAAIFYPEILPGIKQLTWMDPDSYRWLILIMSALGLPSSLISAFRMEKHDN